MFTPVAMLGPDPGLNLFHLDLLADDPSSSSLLVENFLQSGMKILINIIEEQMMRNL